MSTRALLLVSLALLSFACRDPEPSDLDGDGSEKGVDCNDLDAEIYPGADETCDGVDNDCDGEVDEEAVDALTWYADADGDGWGDAADAVDACEAPSGYVDDDSDCNDADIAYHPGAPETDCTDPNDYNCDGSVGYADADDDGWAACEECDDSVATTFPGADEVCNEVDDDCDAQVDEDAIDATTYYQDADGDGFGTDRFTLDACEQPASYVTNADDCDDLEADTWPGADEVCDRADNDCDGTVDEEAIDWPTWYADDDGDGFGDEASTTEACEQPSGYVDDDADCDDSDGDVNPAANEYCNEVDDDCDEEVDEDDAVDASTWIMDFDGDGYGGGRFTTEACEQPTGYVDDATDCDDADDDIYPGANEHCDGEDNDCDGTTDEDDAVDVLTWYADDDGDGYGDPDDSDIDCDQPSGWVSDDSDCDDTDATNNPSALERCDEVDNDCDGDTDEASAVDADTWYMDADSDGYGDASSSTDACDEPSGYVDNDDDCDDSDAAISPAALEYCDSVDNDCDGTTDEDDAADAETWYTDVDGDSYGDPGSPETACTQPMGTVDDATDCHDDDDTAYPGSHETEVPGDGVDQDCDGDDACHDLDCDGYPDLSVAVHHDGDYYTSSWALYSSGTSFSTSSADSFYTYGTLYHAVDDLDEDGYQDLIMPNMCANSSCSGSRSASSYIYWGSSSGYSSSDMSTLPTVGPYVACTGDIDADGYKDIVFGQYYSGSTHNLDSYVYWGSAAGWSSSDRTSLTSTGVIWCEVEDLDADGYEEVILVNYRNSSTVNVNSYVYWGSSSGVSSASYDTLPTHQAHTVAIEDFDGDGYKDLAFANYHNGSTYNVNSYVYWGSSSGFSTTSRDSLPTSGAWWVSAADLDEDGYTDLVYSNYYNGSTRNIDSYVYWGSASGFSSSNRTDLPTLGTEWNDIADLDNDGYLDIVFANYRSDSGHSIDSYVYWGSSSGYSTSGRTDLPTVGAYAVDLADFDDDGFVDIAFGGYYNGSWSSSAQTYVYWNNSGSFSTSYRDTMNLWGAYRVIAVGAE